VREREREREREGEQSCVGPKTTRHTREQEGAENILEKIPRRTREEHTEKRIST